MMLKKNKNFKTLPYDWTSHRLSSDHMKPHIRRREHLQYIFSNGQCSNNNILYINASQLTDTSSSFKCFFLFYPCARLFDGKYRNTNSQTLKSPDILKQYKGNSKWLFFLYIPAPLLWERWEIQNLRILYCIWSSIHLSRGGPNQLPEVDSSQEEKRKLWPSFNSY